MSSLLSTTAVNYGYGPFGEVIRATGPMAKLNPFRFSTKYDDDETDFLYYGYRFYNPSTGRWLSSDPARELAFESTDHTSVSTGSDRFNLHSFVKNSPITFYDGRGLETIQWDGGGQTQCGGWDDWWLINPQLTAGTTYWLVQEITTTIKVDDCKGFPEAANIVWYEALKETAGASVRDHSVNPPWSGYFGTATIECISGIYPDKIPYSDTIPGWTYNGPSPQPGMYQTAIQPEWWFVGELGTATREDSSQWSCCCDTFMKWKHNP